MATYRLHCGTCSFEHETSSLDDALRVEAEHQAEHGSTHEITIERFQSS